VCPKSLMRSVRPACSGPSGDSGKSRHQSHCGALGAETSGFTSKLPAVIAVDCGCSCRVVRTACRDAKRITSLRRYGWDSDLRQVSIPAVVLSKPLLQQLNILQRGVCVGAVGLHDEALERGEGDGGEDADHHHHDDHFDQGETSASDISKNLIHVLTPIVQSAIQDTSIKSR
jgi:hypothetical protein